MIRSAVGTKALILRGILAPSASRASSLPFMALASTSNVAAMVSAAWNIKSASPASQASSATLRNIANCSSGFPFEASASSNSSLASLTWAAGFVTRSKWYISSRVASDFF